MITTEECKFLSALVAVGGKTTRKGLPPSSAKQDKARRSCKEQKLVRYGEFERSKNHRRQDKQWGWIITAGGRRALDDAASQEK